MLKKMKKNQRKYAIQSDTRMRLKKIREGLVYSKRAVFVRELVQNCYRTFQEMKKKKIHRMEGNKIWITLNKDEFTIKDNGRGCDKYEKLFKLDYSGFGVGYGEGFNSIYMVADEFWVETSGYDDKGNHFSWSAQLDIKKALDNPKSTIDDLQAEITDEDDLEEGFKLRLRGERIEEYYYSISKEVEELCKYLPDIDVYLNGYLIEKEDILNIVKDGPYTKIENSSENKLYSGKITLTNDYYDAGIKVYFEHRFVQTININGAKGVIELEPNAVKLRAPDRTEIIYDKKRDRLVSKIEKEVKNLLKTLVANGKKEEIDEYEKIIGDYLDVKEYINYLSIDLSMLSLEFEKESKEEKQQEQNSISAPTSAAKFYDFIDSFGNNNIKVSEVTEISSGEYQSSTLAASHQTASVLQKNDDFSENKQENNEKVNKNLYLVKNPIEFEAENEDLEQENQEVPVDTVREIKDRSFTASWKVNSIDFANKEQLKNITIKDIKKKKNIVWCSRDEQEKYKSYITEFEYKKVYTFISPHGLYDKALRHLGVPHVSEYDNCIEEEYQVTRTGAKNKKEERATELLSRIEKLFNITETFYISDIKCKRKVVLNGTKVSQENVIVNGYEQYGYIHLNRKSINCSMLSGSDIGKQKLSRRDVNFLITNAQLKGHELAHKIFGTKDNTKEHYEKEKLLSRKILEWIVQNS